MHYADDTDTVPLYLTVLGLAFVACVVAAGFTTPITNYWLRWRGWEPVAETTLFTVFVTKGLVQAAYLAWVFSLGMTNAGRAFGSLTALAVVAFGCTAVVGLAATRFPHASLPRSVSIACGSLGVDVIAALPLMTSLAWIQGAAAAGYMAGWH